MNLSFNRFKRTTSSGFNPIQSGFTLIELLIVMAILGVLSVGLVAAINPVEKINAAGDSRAQSDIGVLARSTESYATARNGYYPYQISDLTGSNELKYAPSAPKNQYNFYGLQTNTCTSSAVAGTAACTGVVITYQMQSAKFTSQCAGQAGTSPFWVYASALGQSCVKCSVAVAGVATNPAGATLTCP